MRKVTIFITIGFSILITSIAVAGVISHAWVNTYDGPGHNIDQASSITVDNQGNVYITGMSDSTSSYSPDYATVKYNSAGNFQWVRRYSAPTDYGARAKDITLDGFGNIIVTGTCGHSAGYPKDDFATVKYDPDGNELWVRRYNGPDNDHDRAFAVTAGVTGNVYVTGSSRAGNPGWQDYTTIKYDPDGTLLWLRRYDASGIHDEPWAMAIDSLENVYVTGYSDTGVYGNSNRDFATVKYDSSGNEIWVSRYNGTGNSLDVGYAIAVDSDENVYVTGLSNGDGSGADVATIKYDINGDTVWVRRYNGPGNSTDSAVALAIDGQGNVYVAGGSIGSGTNWDYMVIRYRCSLHQT